MTELTGIKLRMTTTPLELQVKLKSSHRLTNGLGNLTCGVRHRTFPVCFADDPAATTLGTLPNGSAGLVIKPQSDWTAIFSAVPMLPTSLLRRITQLLGGVHEYIDTEDVVWASRSLLAVSVFQPGTRQIRLPRPAAVRDFYSGQEITGSADSFEASFDRHATRLFTISEQRRK